jgi:cytoskeletal protein RodZ
MSETARPGSKTPPWEQGSGGGSFGSWLRQQREIREIALREIAETSKISLRYLEALEQDRFHLLPAPVFARGFLREYARYVGLDGDEVVNYFILAQDEDPTSQESTAGSHHPMPAAGAGHWGIGLLLTAGVLLFVGVIMAVAYSTRGENELQAPPPMAAPLPISEAAPLLPRASHDTNAAPLRVTLDFSQNSLIEAEVDGEPKVNELRVQGESLRLEARERVKILKLGNRRGVAIEVNGIPLPIAANGEGAIDIDLALAHSLAEASP